MSGSIIALRAKTLLLAATGAVVFVLLGLPLPLLLGPLAACLIAALSGVSMQSMGDFGFMMRTFLGVAVGASLTPDFFARLPGMIPTIAMIPLFLLLIGGIGYPFFRRVCGFDHATSFYSAMPGGLQDMLIFGEEAGGDPRALSLIHATRVLVIVTLVPVLFTLVWGFDFSSPPGKPASDVPMHEIGIMVLAGLIGWKLGERLGLIGASILGPMILTAILSLSGVIQNRPPAEMIWAAQFFIGIAVGVKYAGITGEELRRDVAAGLGYCVILGVLSFAFAEAVTLMGLAPPVEAFLAFAPGGQAEMVVLAIIAGADIAYVVTHHIARIILVITLASVIERFFRP